MLAFAGSLTCLSLLSTEVMEIFYSEQNPTSWMCSAGPEWSSVPCHVIYLLPSLGPV